MLDTYTIIKCIDCVMTINIIFIVILFQMFPLVLVVMKWSQERENNSTRVWHLYNNFVVLKARVKVED